MPLIEGNFTEVPDVIPPIGLGTYTWRVVGLPQSKINKEGDGNNLVVEFEIVDEVPDKGRMQTKYYSLKPRPKNAHLVPIKRLFLSAGVPVTDQGMNTDVLEGKTVRGEVVPNNYERNGQQICTTQLDKILIPGDTGYAP